MTPGRCQESEDIRISGETGVSVGPVGPVGPVEQDQLLLWGKK